jgi:16S rRNA (guanine527-N7)-methyltransferase
MSNCESKQDKMEDVERKFQEWCEGLSIKLSPLQRKQFRDYYECLIDWNERINLTAITDPLDVYLKHFFDSLTVSIVPQFRTEGTIMDVGAGAGFPSLPLRIAWPHVSVTILDSLQKRISFLETLVKQLGLENSVQAIHGRAEECGQQRQYREQFDQVTARAVARLPVLAEYCLPFVKVGGMFFALKGPDAEIEVKEGKSAVHQLGGRIQDIVPLELPNDAGKRYIVCIEKIQPTAKQFPRKPGIPQKRPLGTRLQES